MTAATEAPVAGEIVLDVHICDQRRSYLARFATEDQALGFIARRRDLDREHGYQYGNHSIGELVEFPIPRTAERLLVELYPTCDHGLSLDLCYGPGHYSDVL